MQAHSASVELPHAGDSYEAIARAFANEWALEYLTIAIADHLGLQFDTVIAVLSQVPGGVVSMTGQPAQWTALAAYVAHSLGIDAAPFVPTVH